MEDQTQNTTTTTEENNTQVENVNSNSNTNENKNTKQDNSNKKLVHLLFGILVILGVIVLIGFIISNQGMSVKDHVTVKFGGTNGAGYVSEVTMDEELEEHLEKASKDIPIGELFKMGLSSFGQSTFTYGENNTVLSNGDSVDITMTWDEEMLKKFKLKDASFEATAHDLPEITNVDGFKGVKVTFSGTEGKAKCHVSGGVYDYVVQGDSEWGDDDISEDSVFDWKNGDTITLKISESDQDKLLETEEFIETAKDFKVEGLSKVITSPKQITKKEWQAIKVELKDQRDTTFSKDYGSPYYVVDRFEDYNIADAEKWYGYKLEKAYMVSPKEGNEAPKMYIQYNVSMKNCEDTPGMGRYAKLKSFKNLKGLFIIEGIERDEDGVLAIPSSNYDYYSQLFKSEYDLKATVFNPMKANYKITEASF